MRQLAPYFKAVCEPVRLRIIELLMPGELCVCELMDHLELSQPAVSHHMKILKQAGLVRDRRMSRWTFYSLDKQQFRHMETRLATDLFGPVSSCAANQAEVPPERCIQD